MQYTHKLHVALCALLIALGTPCAPVRATENIADTGTLEQSNEAGVQAGVFEYKLEGRPDPFTPFIANQVAQQKIGTDEIVEEDVELTGMRRFEPGQLVLVAILYSGKKKMAMVEDVTGRGYVLDEGMPIGRRGVVSKIEGEQVTIIEVAHTRAGRTRKNKIVMRLNKEGEK